MFKNLVCIMFVYNIDTRTFVIFITVYIGLCSYSYHNNNNNSCLTLIYWFMIRVCVHYLSSLHYSRL